MDSAMEHTVSIENSNIKRVFAVFHDRSLDILQCWNQMQRVRTMIELCIWHHPYRINPIRDNIPSRIDFERKLMCLFNPKFMAKYYKNVDGMKNGIAIESNTTFSGVRAWKRSLPKDKEGFETIKGITISRHNTDEYDEIYLYKMESDSDYNSRALSQSESAPGGDFRVIMMDHKLRVLDEALTHIDMKLVRSIGEVMDIPYVKLCRVRDLLRDNEYFRSAMASDRTWLSSLTKFLRYTKDYDTKIDRRTRDRNSSIVGLRIERINPSREKDGLKVR